MFMYHPWFCIVRRAPEPYENALKSGQHNKMSQTGLPLTMNLPARHP